jgi:hypothetical protein
VISASTFGDHEKRFAVGQSSPATIVSHLAGQALDGAHRQYLQIAAQIKDRADVLQAFAVSEVTLNELLLDRG